MSMYGELQQFVQIISDDAQQGAVTLLKCANNVEQMVSLYDRLTTTTQDSSSKNVKASLQSAQKQMLIAVNALLMASKAGYTWIGDASSQPPQLKLVLKHR